MAEYIDKSDALDILDQFEDAVENGEGGFFYSKAREMMRNLPTEEIIHCKDCVYYCNILYEGRPFERGECDAIDELYCKGKSTYDFCSMARLKE